MTTPTPVLLDAVTVRLATDADAPALLALHRDAYGDGRTLAQWRWRYVDNPLRSTTIASAFAASGECVAAFCGVPLRCLFAGEAALAVRAGDVCVTPRLRGSMAASTLLLRTSDLFFRSCGGGDARVVFGFPEPGLLRAIVRHCRVDVLADVLWLVRDTEPAAWPRLVGCARAFVDGLGEIDDLAARWHSSADTGLVRDLAYLQWRYPASDSSRHLVLSRRDGVGRLRGLVVATTTALQPDALVLAEWLVPRGDGETAAALLAAANAIAHRAGRRCVVASFLPSSPEFAAFQTTHGFRVLGSPYQLVYRSYAARVDRRFLADRWCHGAGDFDFLGMQ